jgi:hypothetical protein
VTAADLLPTERSIDVPAGADVENLEIVARPAALVLGEVVSPSGEPVAGAEIREAGIELVPGAISYTAPLAVTDGDGRFRAGGLRSGALRLEADHPSHQRVIREIDAQPGENRLDFTLEGGSSIDGYVVDFERAPVASARVQVRTDRSGASFPWTRTGVDGRFELTGLAPGRYRLSAEKEGAGRSVGSVDIDVRDDPVSGVELELFPTATITGTIHGLDVDELARVRLQAGGLIGLGTVAFDGSYRIPELSPGPWSVVASLPGTGRFAEGAVVVEPGETEAHLDLDFGGGFVLSGSVIRSERPVSGAGVVALNDSCSKGFPKVATSWRSPISVAGDSAHRVLLGVSSSKRL